MQITPKFAKFDAGHYKSTDKRFEAIKNGTEGWALYDNSRPAGSRLARFVGTRGQAYTAAAEILASEN